MKPPRTTFEKPVVTVAMVSCPRCGSDDLKRDTFPPAGATWNPPSAMFSKAELQPLPIECRCRGCYWCWFPEHPEWRGYYGKTGALRANHDPGDEDRT